MNAETQYLVSGCSVPSKAIPQPVSAERGYRLGVTRKTVKMKSASFQLWVIEENILLELQGKPSAFYFCLKLNQTRLRVLDTQTSMFVTKSPFDIVWENWILVIWKTDLISYSL